MFENIKKDLGLTTELMIIVSEKIDPETEKEFFLLFEDKKSFPSIPTLKGWGIRVKHKLFILV